MLLHIIQLITKNYQNPSETSAIHRDSGNTEENFVINCALPIKNVSGKTTTLKIKVSGFHGTKNQSFRHHTPLPPNRLMQNCILNEKHQQLKFAK